MASNISGVRRVTIQGPQTNPKGPVKLSFPDGEYGAGYMYPDPARVEVPLLPNEILQQDTINLEGDLTPRPSRSPGLSTPEYAADITGPTNKFDTSSPYEKEKIRLQKVGAQAEIASGVIKTLGGVINAQSKYSQTVSKNNFNIQMAQIQADNVVADVHAKMLKEQTKGISRGQSAQLAAVAQGQSAGGDLAQTAMSNEAVYAAENMMNMEINSMRQVFGLESQQRQLESSSRIAGINKDLEMSQAIAGGALDIGLGYAQLPG